MTEQKPTNEDYLLIGEIVGAFGIRGQLKLRSLTDNVEHLRRKIKQVYLGPKHQPYRIKEVFEHKPGLLVASLEGVTNRDEAENLRGTEVTILESQALPLGEGEYYLHELYGMAVLLEDGERFGTVREVLQTGANDVLVVAREGKPDALLPVINDVLLKLDREQKQMVIRLLDGLVVD